MKNRLFVALNLPDHSLKSIVQLRDSLAEGYYVIWEKINKLHLTLKFIGDVDSELIEEISKSLQFIEEWNQVNLKFINFGFFNRNGKPSILWVGLKSKDSLTELVNEINLSLEKFNIPIEYKPFKPHITLLRIKRDIDIDFVNRFKNYTFKPIDFSADTITLYESILDKKGSKYFKIKNYKLK